MVMLPFGVVEDFKEDEKVQEEGASKRGKPAASAREEQQIFDDQIEEKNSYFQHSSDEERSGRDVFNSSLGGWDMNDEQTKIRKQYKSKTKPKLPN